MSEIRLPALRGRNPLGLFAALGALDVATRLLPADGEPVTLRWTEELEPHAVLSGPESIDHLVELCDQDRRRWATSPILTWGPNGTPMADLKPQQDELEEWLGVLVAAYLDTGDRTDLDLMAALLAQGATAGKGDNKPTHFHFTAGKQLFLVMARELRAKVDAERFHEAFAGPWRYDSPLPVLGWDARGERIYALRGGDPAKEKKLGVPGADWLGLLGLRFFPVSATTGPGGQTVLATTGCSLGWKRGTFTWPLWSVALDADVVASLLSDTELHRMLPATRKLLGVHHLLEAPIRRTDQGGYGSFGPSGPRVGHPQRSTR